MSEKRLECERHGGSIVTGGVAADILMEGDPEAECTCGRDEDGDKGEDYWKARCEEAHALLATAMADKEALSTDVANLREAFQGAWETIEYWKKQAEKHRAERDKQFANVVEWHDSLGYLSPGIAAADFKRYKATLKNINLLRLEAENERPSGDAADGWDRAFEEVGRELLAHGIDPEEL